MHPAVPDEPIWESADEVGSFEQGSGLSRWALARYLVGRAILESVSRTLLLVAALILGVAAVLQWVVHTTVGAVLVALVGLFVLVLRWALRAVLRRLTAADHFAPIEARLRALVTDTHADVLRELRRVGLPGRTLTLPLLAIRLIGKRRRETFARLRGFDIDRAVPKARLDEVHMLIRSAVGQRPPA